MSAPSKDQGLSLIELVVAMAIFALVAIMGAQALTGMLRIRDGLERRSHDTAALAQASSLLRADISAALPLAFFPPASPLPQSAIRQRDGVFSLSVGGAPDLQPNGPAEARHHRVEWSVQNGKLTRRVWPVLYPADPDSLGPEQVVMTGVLGLRLRSYLDETGWIDGLPGQTGPATPGFDADTGGSGFEQYSNDLPAAIEVTLVTQDYGDIPILESYR